MDFRPNRRQSRLGRGLRPAAVAEAAPPPLDENNAGMNEFPQSIVEKVGHYVYTLADPRTGKVFYVGKGQGNRVFAHAQEALTNPSPADNLERIREIKASGATTQYMIVRHGMTAAAALEVESALIDYIGLSDLDNLVAGHNTDIRGQMSVAEIVAIYEAPAIVITEPVLLIIINKLFERNVSADRLYKITRGNWPLGAARNNAHYAFAVFRGLVREVYTIESWETAQARDPNQKKQKRWRFTGEVAQNLRHYVGGSVVAYLKKGAQFPVRYINC
jgi:hypothetical protein